MCIRDRFQTLAGHVLYPHPVLRPDESLLLRSAAPQSGLWPLGISGDLPIVLVNIADGAELPLVRQMVRAFEFWRLRRFAVDLVVVNLHSTSYAEDLQQRLEHLVVSIQPRTGSPDSTGRIFPVSYTHLDVYKRQLPHCSVAGHCIGKPGNHPQGGVL